MNLDLDKVRVRIQGPIGLPELDSCPEPDVVWATEMSYEDGPPLAKDALLVIEVADSSLKYDTGEKATLYATAGVTDYWVVDLNNQQLKVFREPSGEDYTIQNSYGVGESVRPLAAPEAELLTSALFKKS